MRTEHVTSKILSSADLLDERARVRKVAQDHWRAFWQDDLDLIDGDLADGDVDPPTLWEAELEALGERPKSPNSSKTR